MIFFFSYLVDVILRILPFLRLPVIFEVLSGFECRRLLFAFVRQRE